MRLAKKIFILLLYIFSMYSSKILSQNRDNIWILGYGGSNTVFNFDSAFPNVHLEQKNLQFFESNASICNTSGNLLFYTNGVKIKNSISQTMSNGDSLNPGWYASSFQNYGLAIGQGQIIIPSPNDSNKYYLFHETIDTYNSTDQPFNLFYSTIDMSLDSNRGAVTQKNISIINDTLIIGEITACKHANGRDWWIVTHRFYSNLFHFLLLTPSGISTSVQNIGTNFSRGSGGQACFSPDGKKYARYHPWDGLDIFDFDRCSGTFSNWQHADSITGYGGVSFSPNSKELYVSAETHVYQFNLADTTQSLNNLKFLVATWDTFYSPNPPFATTFYIAQLAPNGKIYISSTNGVQHIHIINYPDSVGLACDVCQHCILLPTYNGSTIPNFPNYNLGQDTGSVCDTLGLGITTPLSFGEGQGVRLMPNPAKNSCTISSLPPNSIIKIFSSQGLLVYQNIVKENQELTVNTSQFGNGIYFLNIFNDNKVLTKKLSVIH